MRNVIVTGGSRGLGLGISEALAAAGFAVYAVARKLTPELSRAIDSAAEAGSGALHFRSCDLAETTELGSFVKSVRADGGPIYGLVNNAGLGTSSLASQILDADAERLVRLNVTVPVLLTKHVLRSMLAIGTGRIVNISSIVAETGYGGLSAYSATKAAMNGFTGSLARELGPAGITVNAVAPGFVATEMTQELSDVDRTKIERRSALRRMVEITDVASAVAFLMSDKARNITGTVMTVDAGTTA
ncbi:MAG TPA: SDR family NAD(P)-dependent oxidoreductase [Acidisoma sp.]|uniref:SDR family NAD(P)-dependent oxidoreductase n=1 Tax=Acidisoma sp. TaxID=1872115 RepID=UPI002B6AC8AF|nr:SDR family NAD(P)-dependent oxidoreductase [Acidisoma sp.]HTI00454.1 SDR family NAD(P)-dependent oxidoreductase [Acidisoma sp.]